jgi:hypothetical protein
MSLQDRLDDLITSIGTDWKTNMVNLFGSISGGLGDLDTTDKTSLVAAINEIKAAVGAGSPTTLDDLTDVTLTSPANDNLLQRKAGVWVNRTPAQVKTDLALAKGDVGLGNVDNVQQQPINSDLTAIAGLSPSNDDIIQRKAGAWTNRTMAQLKTDLALAKGDVGLGNVDNVQQLPMSYLDTDAALAANSNVKVASQAAVKAYVDGIVDAANALQYKGVINASSNPNYPAASAGHMYLISVGGKIGGASGPNVEVGDMLVCKTDGTASGDEATVGAQWSIIQKNIDGAVTGPASSTGGNLPTFNGTTGKVVQDSGVSISTDGTLATNNNTKVPTEGAIRTYLSTTFYTKTELGNPETDLAALYATAKS